MKVKNWNKFQHYKNTTKPSWIKFHKDTLDDVKIHSLSDKAYRVLMGLWLLASEDEKCDGNLPSVENISFRLRRPVNEIIELIQELDEFIVVDSIESLEELYNNSRRTLDELYGDSSPIALARGEERRVEENNIELDKSNSSVKTDFTEKKITPRKYSKEFEEFWLSYPGPRKKEKPKAYQEWKLALKRASIEQIMQGLVAYRSTKEVREGYAPFPARWLKRDRWEEGECTSKADNDEVLKAIERGLAR